MAWQRLWGGKLRLRFEACLAAGLISVNLIRVEVRQAVAPATKPNAVGHSPPWLNPSSISSNDSAEISTPLPNDMMTR